MADREFVALLPLETESDLIIRDHSSDGGLLRLKDILAPKGPIPVSKSTWWSYVRSGLAPKPIKIGPKITAWRAEDVRAFIERRA
jgi:prophage regulatory protein